MFVVIQVMSARSVSTRDWQIIWGITGRSLPDGELMTLPHFIRKLATTHDGVARFIQECRQEYIVAMKRLLGAITVPKVLFWFSDRRPNELAINGGPLGKYPQLVDDDIMSYLRPFADGYVECVCSNYGNLSHKHDTRFYYPSQKMHAQAADMLCEWATRTIDRPSASSLHHGV